MTLPRDLRPMLAVPSSPFDSPDYLFEVKWDGWRCLAYLEDDTFLQSRNQRNLSPAFPELAEIHRNFAGTGAVLDGEIVTFWEGKPNFIRLQRRTGLKTPGGLLTARDAPAVFIAFDLLYLNHQPLFNHPLEDRCALLTKDIRPYANLQLSEVTPERGVALFEACRRMGLEGVVGKDRHSVYLPGKRSPFWKKAKVVQRKPFLVIGYTTNPTGRTDLSALALAAKIGRDLGYVGLVGSGFSQETIDHLLILLKSLKTETPPAFAWPFTPPPRINWVRPEIICEVEYLELTPDLRLRHPIFRGLRSNCGPEDCRLD